MQATQRDELNVEKIIVVPPDGGWGWVVVGSAFFCVFIIDGISNTFSLLIPIFHKEFNASVSQISLINSISTGFYFIFAPVAGSLSNRFGFRPVIVAGSIISSVGIAVSIFSDNHQLMSATYGLIGGLGFSMIYINVVLTVGFYFEKWRALATAITVSASGVGTLTFAPVVQLLLQKYQWRYIFFGYSCLMILCAFVAICFRPLPAIALDVSDKAKARKSTGKKITSMHNTRYPTAAEALDIHINQLMDSRLNLVPSSMPSWYSSMESLELYKCSVRDYITSRRTSRNIETRRGTEFSQFESLRDLTAPGTSARKQQSLWKTKCFSCWYHCRNTRRCCLGVTEEGVRPLYREDIFYEGSVVQLPDYEKNSILMKTSSPINAAKKSSLLYHLSVTRLPTLNDLEEERDGKCRLCPESMTRALKTMFDFRILKYPMFLLFTISTCFLATGVNVPSYFTCVRAAGLGVMNQTEGSLILMAMGITNTVGRIICGLLGTIPKINMIALHFGFLFFGALLNVAVIFLTTKVTLIVYAALYGFVLAEQGSLRSVLLVQLVGLENLTNAFGILLLFLGIFTVAGTPAAGYMKEVFGSYDAVFLFSAVFLLLAAVSLMPVFLVKQSGKGVQTTEGLQPRPNQNPPVAENSETTTN